MVYTAEQQFISRAKKALEGGNTSFVARGKNNAIWEKLKHEFEQKRTATTPAKRARTSSSSSSSSESSNDATDVTPTIEHVKNEEDVIPMIAEVNDQEDVADVTKIVEGREITPAEPPPANSKPLMSDWTKEILHSFHPRAVVEWSEYAQTRRTNETLNAVIRVAKMLTELEGKDIDECKEEVDIRQKYGADMIWARNFELKFSDTEHAMTIHESVSFTPLLCTVRLIDSVAV